MFSFLVNYEAKNKYREFLGMMQIKDFYKKMCNIEIVLAIISLVFTVSLMTISAIMRTIGLPINWGLDMSLLTFTWSTFLGADAAFREDKLVRVDLLLEKMPQNFRRKLELAIYVMILVFLFSLVYLGIRLSIFSRHRTFQGIPNLSYSWVTISVPICSLLMIITGIIKIYKKFIKDSK
ncbi:MAG: TRAP transporter small permease [Bacteroidales bacterium]|nr:TRAP transporter small permease [Bacteroidales bacterium]